MPANLESSTEIDPDSLAAASVPESFHQGDQAGDTAAGDAAAQAAADAKAAAEKSAADTAKEDADKVAAEAAEKTAKEKADAEKSKTAEELANPHLAAAKKEEAADDDKKPAGMTDKAWVSWKAKNAEVKTAKQEAAAEKAKAQDFESKYNESQKLATELESARKELDDTKKKLADYEGEVYVARIESHPTYKAEVKGPQEEIISGIADLSKRYEVPADTLLRAIQEPDKAKRTDLLEEATADLKAVDRDEVVQSARDWQRLQKKADDMRKDAGQKLKEMTDAEKSQAERQTAKITQDYRDSVKEQWGAAQNTIPYIRKAEGADAWNKHLDGIQREIEALDVGALPVERVSEMAISHKVLPEVMKVAKHFQSQAEKEKTRADAAEAKIKEYLATAPGAGVGSTARENGSSSGGEGDESFVGASFAPARA